MDGHLLNGLSAFMNLILEHSKWLDLEEKLCLVFLMCDDPVRAQCILKECVDRSEEKRSILHALFKYLMKFKIENVKEKFVESFIIIGNYKFVRLLGYSPRQIEELKEIYKYQNEKHYVNLVRKSLIKMCENMSKEEMSVLLDLIEKEFHEEKCHFSHHTVAQMEMNLLYWICEGYLSDGTGNQQCDLTYILRHLKKMNRLDLVEELEKINTNNSSSLKDQTTSGLMYPDNDFLDKCSPIEASVKTIISTEGDCYEMDINNMGLCIIINQRNFVKERMLENGLHLQEELRQGTDYDRDMLNITFIGLGYEVLILENLDSISLRQSIQTIIREKVLSSHSSLILSILSHGKCGTVFGVDGIGVPVQEIENMVLGEQCPQLLGKPKIVIVQACQGNEFQKALVQSSNSDDDLDMLQCDGPVNNVVPVAIPPKADLFTFWASVPGHASARFCYSGTVFIQTLCAEFLKRGNSDHLNDIATYVNDQLSKKHFDKDRKVVTSQVQHTTTKKLFFPYSSKFKSRAAEMLFQKYLIDHLIHECIIRIAFLKRRMDQRTNS